MNVNEIIMNKRIERGVSRKELAEGLGVSESTIYRIETNPNLNPNNKLVKRIYDILRMNVTIIVDDAPIYDEHAHEIDFESYSPTSKSIIFKTIAKEDLGKIFGKFNRLDGARQSNNIGAGLGLSITKEIINLHGGNITAESSNNEVVFHVKIPLE